MMREKKKGGKESEGRRERRECYGGEESFGERELRVASGKERGRERDECDPVRVRGSRGCRLGDEEWRKEDESVWEGPVAVSLRDERVSAVVPPPTAPAPSPPRGRGKEGEGEGRQELFVYGRFESGVRKVCSEQGGERKSEGGYRDWRGGWRVGERRREMLY
ncbi:hypothetical protein Tco_0538132 [Tanacetum coccineum]